MESSTAKRKRALQNRSSRAPSASTSTSESRGSQRRKYRKKADTPEPEEEPDEPYYKVKQIIQQRLKGGKLEYLLDWEDNPFTGEVYEPTWEPEENCTEGLIKSWQKSQNQSQSDIVPEDPDQTSTNPSADGAPTTNLEKRKRVTIESLLSASQEPPPSKKPRRAGTAESARFQSVSQETFDSEVLPEEIKDSYEETDQDSSEPRPRIPQVEIGISENFDRDAYARYLSSSQPSQNSELAQLTQNSGNALSTASQSQASSARRPFLWLEDILDTQELPGSSSYKLSAAPSSTTEFTTAQDSEIISSGFLEAAESRSAQWTSPHSVSQATDTVDSQLAEPESHFADATYDQGNNQSSSPGSHFVGEVSPSSQVPLNSIEDTFGSGSEDSLIRIVESSIASTPRQPETLPTVSTELGPTPGEEVNSSTEQPAAVRFRAGIILQSCEASQDDHHSSSVPFQTQLQLDREPDSNFSVTEFSQHAQIVGDDTQTLQHETSPTPSFTSTEKTISSFEPTWHVAQVISSAAGPVTSSLPARGSISSREDRRGVSEKVPKNLESRAQSQPLTDTQRSIQSSRASTAPLSSQIRLADSQSDINRGQQLENQSRFSRVSTPTRSPSKFSSPALVTPRNQTSSFRSAIDFNMEQTSSKPSPARYDAKTKIAEMMAAARAATAAKQAARSGSTFSPSPAPSPAINETMPSLEGDPTLPVYTPVKDLATPVSPPRLSPQAPPENELDPTCLKVVVLGREEYVIPLPMVSYTRDIYVQTIKNYKPQRYTFLTEELFEETLVGEIDNMMSELGKLCDHQDLIVDDHSTQREAPREEQAKWAENISTKCIFLAEFLPLLQPYDKHVVILVRPGRMLEILESLLIRHKFIYRRADENGWSGEVEGGPMKVTLLPTDGEIYMVDSASVVIAFDSTARSVSYLNDVRTNPLSPTALAPIISLVVTQSVEHLEKCFSTNVESIGRKIKMVSCISQIADNVGKLDVEEYPDPPGAAKLVAEYIADGALDGSWPIMVMPNIEGIGSTSNSPLGYEREGQHSGDAAEPLSEVLHSGMKRHSEEIMMGFGSPKRQKLTPAPVEQENVIADSYESDIVPQSSTDSLVEVTKPVLPEENQGDEPSSLLKRIIDLETQLRKKEATEIELRQINRDLEYRCQDYESSIREIQPKYQEALNDRGQFENEVNLALEREAQMRRQRDAKDAELRRVQDRQDFIDSELDAARLALSASSVPQVAELSSMRAEVERVNAENENLKKRLANMYKEMDYVRSEYQKASNAAAAVASEVREAQSLIAELQEKADNNRVRVHEIQGENEGTHLRQRIKELEAEKSEVVRANEKLEAELKALSNGRRGTRGTSVPRSPRLGGTMSPGPVRPIGRVIQSTGSRGSSPAPGDFGPSRMGFGEALFQGTPGPAARWGNHLQ